MPGGTREIGVKANAHLDLMPTDCDGIAATATHIAVRDGAWFDPGIWANGCVPDTGALVHIPRARSVTYTGASEARLFIVRVDGILELTAPSQADTHLTLDTMIVAPDGHFAVSAEQTTDGTVNVEFAPGAAGGHAHLFPQSQQASGVIGRDQWDPGQISLGLIASGRICIAGRKVTPALPIRTQPSDSERRLILETGEAQTGWAPGHEVAFISSGEADKAQVVRRIIAIDTRGESIALTLDQPITGQDAVPASTVPDLGHLGFIANMTRNVAISTSAAGSIKPHSRNWSAHQNTQNGAPPQHSQGHVMLAHDGEVKVRNCAFVGLGRGAQGHAPQGRSLQPHVSREPNVAAGAKIAYRSAVRILGHPTLGQLQDAKPAGGAFQFDGNLIWAPHNLGLHAESDLQGGDRNVVMDVLGLRLLAPNPGKARSSIAVPEAPAGGLGLAASNIITDFEDGVDAIDFMIQAFGFQETRNLQAPSSATIRAPHPRLRVVADHAPPSHGLDA